MLTSFIGGLAVVVAATATATAYPGNTIIFEGRVYFASASQTCGNAGISTGDRGTIVYRYKVSANDPPDAIDILYTNGSNRAIFNAASQAQSGSLAGQTGTTTSGVDGGLVTYSNVPGSANLGITSFTGGSIAAANNIRINGTINDYFFLSGCVVTIRGALTKD